MAVFISGDKVSNVDLIGQKTKGFLTGQRVWGGVVEEMKFEAVVLVIDSSSGAFIIPVRGFSASSQNAAYNWIVEGSLDGIAYTLIQNASGTSSSTGGITLSIPSGLQSQNMYLRIRDYTENDNYAWARAFGCSSDTTGAGASTNKNKIKSADLSSVQNGFRLNGTGALGDQFFFSTWYGCTHLTDVVFPNSGNWNIASIGDNFMATAFYGCTSLIKASVLDTGNWVVNSIGAYFMSNTFNPGAWNAATYNTAVVPDASNWNAASIGGSFMVNSFANAVTSVITIKDSTVRPIYTGAIAALGTNSMGLQNSYLNTVYVPSALISAFQGSASWSNITSSKFMAI